MSGRAPRFEIVHAPSDRQPWWARFVAGNGRIVWTTESYHRREAAVSAIALVYGASDGLEVREVEIP